MSNEYLVSTNVCPLVLRWTGEGREWSLTIQSKPTPRIYRTGPMPTKLEIYELLSYSNLPASMAPVLMVCVELAEVLK